jgi:hypothetical protein
MIITNAGFTVDTGDSCNIGLGSPQFGHGVYFKELLTELPSTMLGLLLYTVERWSFTTNGVLHILHGFVSFFSNEAMLHLQCGQIIALLLISFPQPGHLIII